MTKKEITERAKGILNTANLRVSLREKDFMLRVLEGHPHAKEKIGCGVDHFFVGLNKYKNRAFFVSRTDGSMEVFSYLECLSPATHRKRVKDAFRTAIQPQIRMFKDAAFADAPYLTCPINGTAVSPETAHVDHTPPLRFEVLLQNFLFWRRVKDVDVELDAEYRLVDKDMERSWQEYHQGNAQLRVTSARGNLDQR